MLALFGIGFFEMLILAAIFGVIALSVIITVVIVVSASRNNSKRD